MTTRRAALRKRMVVVERHDESDESSEEEAEFEDDDYQEEEDKEEEDEEKEEESVEEKEEEEEEKRPKHNKGRITISLKGQKVCKVCKATDHRAGFVGYVYMDCPNKPCYLCRTPGHTTLTCPHRTATEHGVVAAPRRRSLGLLDFVHERQLRSNLPTVHLPQVIPNKVYSAIIRLHSRRVTDMEFHPTNDNILISGDKRGQIGIWDFEKVFNKTVHDDIHAALVNSIKFHPWQEGMMYTASSDGKVCFTDIESGTSSDILDLNPDGWAGPSTWRSIHGMNLNNRRELALATDNFGFLYQLDTRANKKVEKPMLVHKKGSKVVGVDCHPVDFDVFLTCGNDHKTRLWDMRKLTPDSCLAELDHPRVVTSAYFSPVTGNKIMTTCLDNRIRVWDNICADLSAPSREIVHSHNFNRYITSFRAEWDPKDRSECLAVIGRYISDQYDGALLHPIDFLDVSNGRLAEEVYDKSITTICTVNKLHPRLDCMATGSSRSLFIWRPKDAIRDAPENEAETSEEKEVKKIALQIYEADGGKAGRAKGKVIDNDDDDFAFMKKKVTAKSTTTTTNGAGPSTSTKKEKSKRKSKSEDDDAGSGDDTEEPSPEKGKAVVTPRQYRRRSSSTCTKKENSKRKSKFDDDSGDDTEDPSPEKGKAVVTPPSEGRVLRRRSK